MTEFQQMGERNRAIRGYILRLLVKGVRFSMPVRRISDMLQRDGYVIEADIATYLDYLYELNFIKFLKPNSTPSNAYMLDGAISLTSKGIRFIEDGGTSELGIEL